MPVRLTSSLIGWAPRSAGWTWLSPPPRRPTGVRTASKCMSASSIANWRPGGDVPYVGGLREVVHAEVDQSLVGAEEIGLNAERHTSRSSATLLQ